VAQNRSLRWTEFVTHWPLWALYIAHFAMNWSNYIIMQWLPTYLARNLSANKESISFTALPYIVNSLIGIGRYIMNFLFRFYFFYNLSLKIAQYLSKRYMHFLLVNKCSPFYLFLLVAGHSADTLIQKRWSVLSVRRLMTNIGLIGPGAFLLAFCAVDNLLAAVVYVILLSLFYNIYQF